MDPRLIRKVRRRDRIANWVITAGGLFVIVCVLGILVLIARVALPLFDAPEFSLSSTVRGVDSDAQILAVGLDEYKETAYTLDARGHLRFYAAQDGTPLARRQLASPGTGEARLRRADWFRKGAFSLLWEDGAVSVLQLKFQPEFSADGRRTITPIAEVPARKVLAANGAAPGLAVARHTEDDGLTVAEVLADGRLRVHKQIVTTSLLGGSSAEDIVFTLEERPPGGVTALALLNDGSMLYAGTATGHILRWDIRDPEAPALLESIPPGQNGRGIATLGLLIGESTLIVADDAGGLSAWFAYQHPGGKRLRLDRVHELRSHDSVVEQLAPSMRTKMLVSRDADGTVHVDHVTTQRPLLTLETDRPLVAVGLNDRADGLVGLDAGGQMLIWDLHVEHPEVAWSTYFGKLWYESYREPTYVWQSAGATDEFEPKLSLMPLIFGTLKGTFYGMLFAAPLGVLGAMYTSSLMHPRMRRYIKPAFEIMGSLPTVVIGFLAALWLAPLVRASLTAFLLMLGFLPLTVIAGMALYERLRAANLLRRSLRGYEFALMIPVVMVAVYASFLAGQAADALLFGGDLVDWLFETWGVRVDQRNSIIISMALGFAVLPTVFTISDDALTNVPRNLTAASLALGASRWQTVWRVILPSASPGIFAALMIGFGRAIGETMIVLMATGNTPIMDLSAFNGMRTLSANIAVEIPEAPEGGTLYRTLFLSAVLLFMATFVLNSVAEVVRIRLRRKFGQY